MSYDSCRHRLIGAREQKRARPIHLRVGDVTLTLSATPQGPILLYNGNRWLAN